MVAGRWWLILPFAALAGCAPTRLLDAPIDWPTELAGRRLYATPNATIYAAHPAAAGEMDRLVVRAREEYVDDVGSTPPRPLIIALDRGEPLPGSGGESLLRAAARIHAQSESDSSGDACDFDENDAAPFNAIQLSALTTGTRPEVLLASMPLPCDEECMREVLQLPAEISADVRLALILPTQARLRENMKRVLDDVCRMYRIGPVARALLAPIAVIAQARAIHSAAKGRRTCFFVYWTLRDPSLSAAQKREIAAAWRDRMISDMKAQVGQVSRRVNQRAAAAPLSGVGVSVPPGR